MYAGGCVGHVSKKKQTSHTLKKFPRLSPSQQSKNQCCGTVTIFYGFGSDYLL